VTAPPARLRPPSRRGRVSLQIKVAVAVVLIVLVPLLASAYLVGELGKVAASFAEHEADKRMIPMQRALTAYNEVFAATKALHEEIAQRIALRPEIASGASGGLDTLLRQEANVFEIAVDDAAGAALGEVSRPLPGPGWILRKVEHPLPDGKTLRLGFAVRDIQPDMQSLKAALVEAENLKTVRTALPEGYTKAFLYLLGGAALAAALLGVLAARRLTGRVSTLVGAARDVSAGRIETRVALPGRDEMAELGQAFNTMLDDLDSTRRQVEYLQRIGAWQEVARRLAHEIKNPLTPIQLAVQQCVSAYGGDDARFKKLLTETGEIVEEEIAGLRRLVDTFRTLGQLPRVDPVPLEVGDVVEQLEIDPAIGPRLVLAPPPTPVRVRGDKLLLKRVLTNLVENGIQAGQEAGTAGDVAVGWTAVGPTMVAITVDDHGKGVAPGDRDRIFEPYVTTKPTGTGLGLAIAKKIALEHGGDLAVSPEPAPTGGARFILTLPVA
jgi:nitrogen fixation/metabolism regulation signal transduction histidine kinase